MYVLCYIFATKKVPPWGSTLIGPARLWTGLRRLLNVLGPQMSSSDSNHFIISPTAPPRCPLSIPHQELWHGCRHCVRIFFAIHNFIMSRLVNSTSSVRLAPYLLANGSGQGWRGLRSARVGPGFLCSGCRLFGLSLTHI